MSAEVRSRTAGVVVDALQSRIREAIVPLHAVIARVPRGGALVDLGCGQGLLLDDVLPLVDRVVGVDFDARKLQMARARLGDDPKLSLVQADLFAWFDTTTERFDSALMVDTLSSFSPPDQDRVLRGAAHVLAPGGVLLLKVIDAEPVWKANASRALSGLIYRVLKLSLSHDQRFWYRPTTELAAVLQQAGCVVERVVLHRRHPIPHVLLVARKPTASSTAQA